MISETLITPHPNKQKPEDTPMMLDELIDSGGIVSRLTELKDDHPESYDDGVSEAARAISKAINKSLWFEYNPDAPLPITEEYIGEHQRTSCFGYAICASESMEKANVEHWVALANNHAFILVPLRGRNTTLLINPTNPKLDGEIPAHQKQLSPTAVDEALAYNPRGLVWFAADAYAKYTKNKDFLELVSLDLGGWLTTESDGSINALRNDQGRGAYSKAPSKIAQERRLAATVHEPEIGRDVMQHYGLFQHFTSQGDTLSASKHLQALGALYPEIDSRSTHRHFMEHLKQALDGNDYETAQESIDLLYSSLRETRDPRADILRADLVRKLGRYSKSTEVLLHADELYSQAEKASNANMIARKREKIANIIANIALENKSARQRLVS